MKFTYILLSVSLVIYYSHSFRSTFLWVSFVSLHIEKWKICPLVELFVNLINCQVFFFITNRCLSLENFVHNLFLVLTNIYRVYKVAMTMRVFVRFDSVKSPNDKIAEVLKLPRFAYVFLCVQSVVVSVGLTLSTDFNHL